MKTRILRFVYDPHTAATQFLQDAVVRDHLAAKTRLCFQLRVPWILSDTMTEFFQRGLLKEAISLFLSGEQRLDFEPQAFVSGTSAIHEGRSSAWIEFQR